jgi:multisubunit Na+/H+ antiporter MnhF subunit
VSTPRRALVLAAVLLGIAAILAAVGGPAAVASYHHAYEVAKRFGETPDRAAWLPLTTDGMLVAALIVMYSRRWNRERVGFIPVVAFIVGTIGTLAANLASADAFGAPTLGDSIGRLSVAVWAPISFAVTLELVAVMLGRVRDTVARLRAARPAEWPATWKVGIPDYPYRPVVSEPVPEPVPPGPSEPDRVAALDKMTAAILAAGPPPARRAAPITADEVEEWHASRPARPARKRPGGTVARPGTNGKAVRWTDADETCRMELQDEADANGTLPTVRAIRAAYGMGTQRAEKIAARLLDPARAMDTEPGR